MTKYEEGLKREAVQAYLAGSLGFKSVSAQYGVDAGMLEHWVACYREHGDAGLRKKFSHYDAAFKWSVLTRMQREALSYRQTAVLYDIRGGAGVIAGWQRAYDEGGLVALEPKRRGRLKMKPVAESPSLPSDTDDPRTREDLLKELEYLRAEVAYLKKLRALRQEKAQAAQKKRGSCSN